MYVPLLGSAFWRSNKRVKAVDYHRFNGLDLVKIDDDDDLEELPPFKREKLSPVPISSSFSSSDDEEVSILSCKPSTSKGKSKKVKGRLVSLEERLSKLEKSRCNDNKEEKLPLIEELFKCMICKGILKQDCHLLLCCSQLACSDCIAQWTSTNTSPTCPLCRANIDTTNKPPLPRSLCNLLEMLSTIRNETTSEL